MSAHAEPVSKKFLTPGVKILIALTAMGVAVALYRGIVGIGPVSNLDNQYPWGLWNVIKASLVALAAGGFTTAALAHIFHREHYEIVVRPALLTATLCYTFFVLGLLVDLGKYYAVWHPAMPWMWQGNSVLFEVGICVMIYLHVLYIEFLPTVCERFIGRVALPGPLAALNGAVDALLRWAQRWLSLTMSLFIIAGVVLSFMHQSSLGALMLIAPTKMHPLWYTPILPLLFLLSAMATGFPVVILESLAASKTFGKRPPMRVLQRLSRIVIFFLGLYILTKFSDLFIREAHVHLLTMSSEAIMFLLEVVVGLCVPFVMLTIPRVRRTPSLLFTACALVAAGVILNRFNVFLMAYNAPYADYSYYASFLEILLSIGQIAGLLLCYRIAVTIFPVLPADARPARPLTSEG